jgi:hypothetical protein
MTPHSLTKFRPVHPTEPPAPFVQRYGRFAKGAAIPETTVSCCPRRKVSDFPPGWLPARLYEKNLEQNQLLASCCRHPENHEIEAFKSHPDEPCADIYVFYCPCGRKHRRFMLGAGDVRPEWK